MRRAIKDECFVTAEKLGSSYQPEGVSGLLTYSKLDSSLKSSGCISVREVLRL